MRFRYRSPFDKSVSMGGLGDVVSYFPSQEENPPYGTLIQNYPSRLKLVSEGGGYVVFNGTNYPNTIWNVNELANGIGGTFYDWENAAFVQYETGQIGSGSSSSAPIIINGYDYGAGCSYSYNVYHDGMGGTYDEGTGGSCTGSGTYITSSSTNTYLSISGTSHISGYIPTTYYHDGSGGYYSTTENAVYYNNGTYIQTRYDVPLYLYLYTPDGLNYVGSFQNGVATVEDYHDGMGSYYTNTVFATYTESGEITTYNYQTDVAGYLYNNGRTVTYYFQPSWNNYYSYAEYFNYYSYGTYIWDDGYNYYYWDGYGGYYTQNYF